MLDSPLRSIVFPTDFSAESRIAFVHALRIAVAARGILHLLHIGDPGESHDWSLYPHVRETLAGWGMIEAGASEEAVEERLGVHIRKAHVKADDPVAGILSYLALHQCDLLVLAAHAGGLKRLLVGSVSEAAARAAHAPALFLRDGQKGFVDPDTGEMALRRILAPIAATPDAGPFWRWLSHVAPLLDPTCRMRLLHVGEAAPRIDGAPAVELRRGPVTETILAVAEELGADLIAMPTRGRHGWVEALTGRVSAGVIHAADRPVLVFPGEASG
jgi:nucleotide-binding universal stress UspA family protein